MEEDIKILEELFGDVELSIGGWVERLDKKEKQALENLIKGYREKEERNKELYETCCRYEDTLGHYECNIFDELDDYIKLEEISKLDKIGIKGKKYISESKIIEKIKKLAREFEFYAGREHFEWEDGEFDGDVCDDIALKIQALKELMEDK